MFKNNPRKSDISEDFYVFDVETNGLRAKPDAFIFGCVYGQRGKFKTVIHNVEEFKEEFQKERYNKKIVFAHNAEFDLSVLYDIIYAFDKEAIFNGKFICATNGNCRFADSLNLLPASVKNIGLMSGSEKMDLEQEYIDGEVKQVTQEMIDYCMQDCRIVYNALMELFSFGGNIKITLASLSKYLFQWKYLPHSLKYDEIKGEDYFQSYYGGRTECFKLGEFDKGLYKIDINSLYPFYMKDVIFPDPAFFKKEEEPKVFHLEFLLKHYEGCAMVNVTVPDTYFPCLPYKDPDSFKLLFPVGTFTTCVNFPELRKALEMGAIINHCEWVNYSTKKVSGIFDDYVNDLYSERKKEANPLKKFILKLFMNSLYGKFAQREKTKMIYFEYPDPDQINSLRANNKLIDVHMFSAMRSDGFLEVVGSGKAFNHSIPCLASYITSYVRLRS